MSPSGELGAGVTVLPPVCGAGEEGNEPEEHVGEVDPDGVLHALDAAVTLRVLVKVQLG